MNRAVSVLAVAVAGISGCGPDLSHDGPRAPTTVVTSPSSWTITGTLGDLRKAIDGDVQTAAVSANTYENAQVTIDLGKMCLFNQVIIDHGPNEYGFTRRVSVLTSRDGKDYVQQHVGPGTRRATYLCLPSPVLARYVRLQVVQQGDQAWSVAEIYLR